MKNVVAVMSVGIVLGVLVPVEMPGYVKRTERPVTARTAVVSQPAVRVEESPNLSQSSVKASWYGVKEYCEKYNPKCVMANGQKLNDDDFTAACAKRWKLGDMIPLSYNGKTVVVKCTDRGSFEEKYDRQLDLSKAAFSSLAPLSRGVIDVQIGSGI